MVLFYNGPWYCFIYTQCKAATLVFVLSINSETLDFF